MMWEDEIVEKIHQTREEHAKAFNYDITAICEDWRRRQEDSDQQFVILTREAETTHLERRVEQKS